MASRKAHASVEATDEQVLIELNAAWSRFPDWTLGRVLLHIFHVPRLLVADNDYLVQALREAKPATLPPLNSAGTDEELDPMRKTRKR